MTQTNTYQALCDDVGAYIHLEGTKERAYIPEAAEMREHILCLALNTYRDMLADINDVESINPKNLFNIALEWINRGLDEKVLSAEEVKEAICG